MNVIKFRLKQNKCTQNTFALGWACLRYISNLFSKFVRSIDVNKLSYDGYTLKWEEQFDGDKLNIEDWKIELHEPGWVN